MTRTKPIYLPDELVAHLPDFLTVPDVAAHLGVHKDTVRRMIRTGALQAFYVGKVLRIPRAALADALEPAAPWAVA